jgi:hypothetical protein
MNAQLQDSLVQNSGDLPPDIPEDNEKELVKSESTQVVKYSVTLERIAKLKEEYKEVPTDLAIKSNYATVKKATALFRGLRGEVETRRKELKADALAWGKKVDGTAKEITEKLLEIEVPFSTAKKEFDTRIEVEKREKALAEERRVNGIAERIAMIKALVTASISAPSMIIKAAMDKLSFENPDEWAMEFSEKAKEAISETNTKLTELYTMKHGQEIAEDERIVAEAKRKEEEEAARVAREAELKKQREELEVERNKLAAENKRIQDEAAARDAQARAEQAEKDKIAEQARKEAAEEQAKKDVEDKKIQAEKDALAEAERMRMADKIRELENKNNPPPVATEVTRPAKVTELPEVPFQEPSYTLDQYRDAGNAMLEFIGNKSVTKALLDAIIKGAIKNIYFQGV